MTQPISPASGVNVTAKDRPTALPEPDRKAEAQRVSSEEASNRSAEISEALESLGKQITLGGRVAEFSYDSDLDRIVIRVYSGDSEPREVIRQIPPEEYLAFVARVREFLGVLLDEVS